MDTNLKIYRCYDVALIYNMLHNPVLLDARTEDGVKSDYWPDVVKSYYLVAVVDNINIGVFILKQAKLHTFEAHIAILPEYRKEYAETAMLKAAEWTIENIQILKKIVVFVPEKYKNVIKFIKKFGFNDEGCIKKCHFKDGSLMDEYILGITVDEIKEQLWQLTQ